jgi:hypothetical protein
VRIRPIVVLAAAVVVAAGVAVAVVVTSAASTSNALYSFGGWGAGTPAPIGQQESMVGIPLCVHGKSSVTLESITPVRVTGNVHFDQMFARRGGTSGYAFYRGTAPRARPVAGFVVPPTPSCNLPHTGSPRYEAVAVAHRTGRGSGEIDGFRVRYRDGRQTGVYTIDVTYQLCGSASC